MSRSADEHDRAYRRIEAAGGAGWDDLTAAPPGDSYDGLRAFLASPLAPRAGGAALDLGTGGGQAAILLARHGYATRGVDFSETAIRLAGRNAAAAGLAIGFAVADCLDLSPIEADALDLVVDNHALHCVAGARERAAFLASVRRVLRPGGVFFSEMMSCEGDFDPARVNADPVTRVARNGLRIWVSRDEIAGELERAGLAVVSLEARASDPPGSGALIVAVARRPAEASPRSP